MPSIIEITNFSAPELAVYSVLSESQLLHYYEPDPGIFIAESPNVILRALAAGYEPISFLTEKSSIEKETADLFSQYPQVPVYTADTAVLTQLTGFALTRGLLCAMRRRALPELVSLCANARRIAVLEDVMNPTNIGAIFRCAAALGIDAVLLTPACSDPFYRRAARVSMGTVFQIPFTYFSKKSLSQDQSYISILQEMGFKTVAMALTDNAVSIDDPRLMQENKLAIIMGTEGNGLCDTTIASSDYTVCIPMSHQVDSLNVAAASAIAFWQLTR